MGMIILDDRHKGSVIANTLATGASVYNDKDTNVIDNGGGSTIVTQPISTEVVALGDGQYLRGEKGDLGKTPDHRWVGTAIQFRQPSGLWGPLVDLKGIKGDTGNQGVQGPTGQGIAGNPGITRYTWVKYSTVENPTAGQMYNELAEPIYIGLAYNKELAQGGGDPAEGDPSSYSWLKMKGADGAQGAPGAVGGPGAPGTSFTWIGSYTDFPTTGPGGRDLRDGDSFLLTTTQKVYTYAGGWFLMLESGGAGPIGPQGAPGGSFQYQGEFSNPPASAQVNWLYKDTDNDVFYTYDGVAWVTATSDGKETSDGAPVGGGYRFYTTYSSSVSNPGRPLGDGNQGAWNVNPHSFEPGAIKWVAQKLAIDPQLGIWELPLDISTHGFRGPQGFRGSQTTMVAIVGWDGNWNDALASQSCIGGAPAEWDIITLYKANDPEIQETRRWGFNSQTNVWEWLAYNYQFLGDVLVDGSLDANAINAGTQLTVGSGDNVAILSGNNILYRLWAGSADPWAAPFRVSQDGILEASGADINGRIDATELFFPDSDGEIGQLSLTQLSGGGHASNVNQGWGIYEAGNAIFNGGLSTKNALIEGATIIGAELYSGNLLYLVDPDTDNNPSDPVVYYLDYPSIPVGARESYNFNVTFNQLVSASANTTVTSEVLPAATTRSPISSNRFRWGKINAEDIKFNLEYPYAAVTNGNTAWPTSPVAGPTWKLQLINHSNNAVLSESSLIGAQNLGFLLIYSSTLSFAGITYDFKIIGSSRDVSIPGFSVDKWQKWIEFEVKNRAGTFGTLSGTNSVNGYLRLVTTSLNTAYGPGTATYKVATIVNNQVMPA